MAALEEAQNDARQVEARQTLTAEANNWRAAWAWAVAQRRLELLQPALESLRIFLDRVGWYTEGGRLFEAAAETEQAVNGEAGQLYGQLIARLAWFYHRLDRFEAAHPLLEHSLAIFSAAWPPLPAEAGLALHCLSNLARARGDFAQAVAHGQASVAQQRAASSPRALAAALNGLGAAYTELDDLTAAQQAHAESLALKRAVGDRSGAAVSLVNLGTVALAQGRYADTKPLEAEALTIFRETSYPMGEAVALNNLGTAHYMLGEYAEAEPLLHACLTLCRELGHRYIAAYALANLGAVAGGATTRVPGSTGATRYRPRPRSSRYRRRCWRWWARPGCWPGRARRSGRRRWPRWWGSTRRPTTKPRAGRPSCSPS